MKLILSQYKLIVQAFKHHNLEKILSRGSSCTIWKEDFKESWNLWKKKNGPFLKKSLGSPMPLVQRNFFFKWHKGLMPLVQSLFFFLKIFLSFWERFGNLEFFFFFCFLFLIYILKQSLLNAIWNFWIQKKHRNME